MIAQLQKHVRLWFLTAIALLAAVPPAIARDFTYEYAGHTLTYTVLSEEDKTCETKQGNSAIGGEPVSGTVVIPETISDGTNSYTVTTIGSGSFYRTHDSTSILTTVELPSSVTTIGELAFANCTGLKSIKITSSLTTIGEYAFCDCSALTSIELPSSLTTIGNSVFEGCSSLTTIEIPNSVTTIDEYAFRRCTGLTSIEFPSSVTTIGQSAFAECTSLTSVEIPSSVTTIGGGVFSGCANLTSAVYNSDADAPLLFRDCPISDLTIGGAIVPYLGVVHLYS